METRYVGMLYTGGTIGMMDGPRGFEPVSGYLSQRLQSMPTFHVPGRPALTLPRSRLGVHVQYEIIEFENLQDSANMRREDWVRIAHAIEKHYDRYHGFVVLHGTDTMAYTASALSFMLAGLGKSVVLTGSQIPLARVRNDAVENLLGALMMAGHYTIPEVGIFFNGRLYRGNRASKVDASGFNAFRSGNFPPLAETGVQVDVRWDLIWPPADGPLHVRPIADVPVAAVRLFPGIRPKTLEQFLAPPTQGLILETYGSGNGPSDRPDFLRVLREAVDRGVVIVNVTQCHRGQVSTAYEAGVALAEVGVVPGGDMTPEAALTKLQWLLSQDLTVSEVRDLMGLSLRGELTEVDPSPRLAY
ncbi:MAG: asparaginase [Myxococcota bacterium]